MHSRSQTNVSFLDETREGELQRTFLRRVASMPLVSSTYDMAATAYNSSKNNHPYVKYLCNAAEKGVKTLTEAAVNSAQPILTKLEPQIAAASEYANKSLDTLEGKLPVLQMTADKVACDTKEMVSAKMASAKDAIASKLSGVVNLTKEAVQGSMEATKSAISHSLTSAAATRVGRMAVGGAEAMLGMSEELVDKYLPITDEELAELAETLEDEDVVPVQEDEDMASMQEEEEVLMQRNGVLVPVQYEDLIVAQQRKQKAYLVRLGSLSNKLRNRAYQHSLAKMKLAGRNIQDSLFQLQQTMNLPLKEVVVGEEVGHLTVGCGTTSLLILPGNHIFKQDHEKVVLELRRVAAVPILFLFTDLWEVDQRADWLDRLERGGRQIEHSKQSVDQKFQEGQEKLSQMWLVWSKTNPDAKQPGCKDVAQLEVETQSLFCNMACTIICAMICKLNTTYQSLVSSIQGFPASLQDKVQQVGQSTGELHTTLSTIGCFQELSSTLLAQSRWKVLKAQKYMDELLEYVVHSTPLSWMVGPFVLSDKPLAEGVKPDERE